MSARESLFQALRQKRQFIPGGHRDDDGVWHDGPHQVEFDAALDSLEGKIYSALHHCKRERFLEAERTLRGLVND